MMGPFFNISLPLLIALAYVAMLVESKAEPFFFGGGREGGREGGGNYYRPAREGGWYRPAREGGWYRPAREGGWYRPRYTSYYHGSGEE